MRSPMLLVLVVTLAGAARAESLQLCDEESGRGLIGCTAEQPKIRLVDYHRATPLPPSHPSPGPVVRASGSAGLFLLGLGLVAGGLVLGAGGFAILLICHGPTSTEPAAGCYSREMTYVGWALAAPGILPLAAGVIILYALSGGRRGELVPSESSQRWVFSALPLQGGGMIGASTRW